MILKKSVQVSGSSDSSPAGPSSCFTQPQIRQSGSPNRHKTGIDFVLTYKKVWSCRGKEKEEGCLRYKCCLATASSLCDSCLPSAC